MKNPGTAVVAGSLLATGAQARGGGGGGGHMGWRFCGGHMGGSGRWDTWAAAFVAASVEVTLVALGR